VKKAIATLTILVLLAFASAPVRAQGVQGVPDRLAYQPPPTEYVPPGASLGAPPPERRSITTKWWFWAAVGGVVAATVVVILVAGKSPSPPKSILGNMEGFRGQ
jgi:hypothetical protein